MIVIIDYKTGNVGSILNMLKKIGCDAKISEDIATIKNAEKLILPGVGAFDSGMQNLLDAGLIPMIEDKVKNQNVPILGICLGMQLFMNDSEEGKLNGLGWIQGSVKKFQFENSEMKIPHMGWNTIEIKKEDTLLKDLPKETRFYFVHSYHVVCNNEVDILATTNYGYDFDSIIRKENIWGVQFHPEKSHRFGMQLLKNFAFSC